MNLFVPLGVPRGHAPFNTTFVGLLADMIVLISHLPSARWARKLLPCYAFFLFPPDVKMQDLLVEKSYDWKTQSFHDCVRYNLGYYSFHELSSSPSQVQVAGQFRANLNFSSLFFSLCQNDAPGLQERPFLNSRLVFFHSRLLLKK